MKLFQKIAIFIGLITLLSSYEETPTLGVREVLSKTDTRKEIMDSIAHDIVMSKEMINLLMKRPNSKPITIWNHKAIMKMVQDYPTLMNETMHQMIEKCKDDITMMMEQMPKMKI